MPQVALTIGDKTYRMACADGEEPRIQALAAHFDARVNDLGARFPRMPTDHLFLMAALLVTDELFEAREELQGTLKQIARLGSALKAGDGGRTPGSGEMAQIVRDASARLDRLGDPRRPEARRDAAAPAVAPGEPKPVAPPQETTAAPEATGEEPKAAAPVEVKSGKLAKG